jgi:hypothetical protein
MTINELYYTIYDTTQNGLKTGLILHKKGRSTSKGTIHIGDIDGYNFILKIIKSYPPSTISETTKIAPCVIVSNILTNNGLEWTGHLDYKGTSLVYFIREELQKNGIFPVLNDPQEKILNAL